MFRQLCLTVLLVCLTPSHVISENEKQLKAIVAELSRQVQLQQFAFEEQTRMNGGSGLKQQRASIIGSRPYYTETHTGSKIAQIHEHANHINTVGLGESVYVMNGVEFRTRHNDYPIYMPHSTSGAYNAMERVPQPDVPPEVLEKETIEEQIEELKLWFKAWRDQDYSERDYRKYFKPVLCYMEGGWYVYRNKMEESFDSDRHFNDALTWPELLDKVRFNAYMGRKNVLENYAYLPRKIINITENGVPEYAQWNYRILCHPLKRDLPFKYLVQEDDLQARMVHRKTLEEFKETRGARFRIEGEGERTSFTTLLDELMSEVPGRDNYQGYLTETSLGDRYMDFNKTLMNVAYYHRTFMNGLRDASGRTRGKLGFADPNLFVAETTQQRVAPMYTRMCTHRGDVTCLEAEKRVTYAIPLEIIYLTPLHSWNPYNITHLGIIGSKLFNNNGQRNGGFTKSTAFPGTSTSCYYRIPTEFFGSGETTDPGAADTAAASLGILDSNGQVRRVSASGARIFLPEIEGVGVLRTRYPIMPIHGEASPVWKELNALKDVVLNMKTNAKYLNQPIQVDDEDDDDSVSRRPSVVSLVFRMSPARYRQDRHIHLITLTGEQRRALLINGESVHAKTSVDSGHSHDVVLGKKDGKAQVILIDGKPPPSPDGHLGGIMWHRIDFSDGTTKLRDS